MSKLKENQNDIDEYQEHLNNLEYGAGCTEIWEHVTEFRGE